MRLRDCISLRFVREGVNVLLPVASVGGEVVGGRLLTFWGVAGSLAAASLLADMLIQVATQGAVANGASSRARRVAVARSIASNRMGSPGRRWAIRRRSAEITVAIFG